MTPQPSGRATASRSRTRRAWPRSWPAMVTTPAIWSGRCKRLQYEGQALGDGRLGQFDQFIAEARIGLGHGLEGAAGFVQILFALGVLAEDLGPDRGDEGAPVRADVLRRPLHMGRDRQAAQRQIADHVRDAAIE